MNPDQFINYDRYLEYCLPDNNLENNFRANGVLYPIIIARLEDDKFFLVDGLKRLRFCLKNKLEIPISNYSREISNVEELLELRLELNDNGRKFSPLEKLHIAKLALARSSNPAGLMKKLKIPRKKNITAFIEQLENFPREIPESIANMVIKEQALDLWSNFSTDEILEILEFIKDLRLNINQDKKLLNYLRHLKVTGKVKIKEILEVKKGIKEKELTPPKLIDLLLDELEKDCYPTLSKYKNEIGTGIRNLKLPKNIRLSWKDFGEENEFEFNFICDSVNGFSGTLEILESLKDKEDFRGLFDTVMKS